MLLSRGGACLHAALVLSSRRGMMTLIESLKAPCPRKQSGRAAAVVLAMFGAGWTGAALAAGPKHGGENNGEQCINCHGQRGKPNMPGFPYFSRGERLMQSDNDQNKTISRGKGMMPAYQGLLSEKDIFDVVAYLRTLR